MVILQLFFVALMVKHCQSEFLQVFHPFNPISPSLIPICPPKQHPHITLPLQTLSGNTTAAEKHRENLKFLLPFLDMEIEYDRNLHVMQEMKTQQIFILHGHELYQMFLSRREKRLSLMAVLEGSVRHVEPLSAKILYWHGNFLLVIALDEYLEVYQLPKNVLIQRAEIVKDPKRVQEPPPTFEAIQQLTLTGKFQKMFLFYPTDEHVMIIAAVNFTKLHGKLSIFEWFNTYFDPIEEITIPAIHVINVIGFQKKYLITGRSIKHQKRTILTVYEINSASRNLMAKQTLTVDSRVVHIFTFHHRNMIVACSHKQAKCSSFRQSPDGQFSVYRHRSSKEFAFDVISPSLRFVSAARENQVRIFTNHRLDCYVSFMSDQADVTNLIGYQNELKEDYVLVVYKRPFKVLVRIVELEIYVTDLPTVNQTETEEILASTRHQHLFETTVGQLRSLLLQRKMDMDIFRKVSHILKPKLTELEVPERIILHEGKVGIIRVEGQYFKSPTQIMQMTEQLRQTYLPHRSKRFAANNKELRNVTMPCLKARRIKVENLVYQGDVIEGFSLNATNLQQRNLSIKPKVITHLLNASELILPFNMRNTRQQIIPDLFFDLIPSIRVTQLKVNSINGVSWNEFYDSLFLKNRDKSVKGRLVFQSPLNVKHLTTRILNDKVVSSLFNLKHPQVIHSDLVISRFFVPDLKAKTVNGLIFEDDIVFSGNDTLIETPVKMYHLSIIKDLFLANNTKVKRIAVNSDKIEFKQFYTNEVIVNGSLIVNNLKKLNNKTKFYLDEEELSEENIQEKYLLREQEQNFSFPVVFSEAKVTAAYLETNYLNDHLTEQHLLVNKANTDKPLLLVFMRAYIRGDLKGREYKSKIVQIKENIIRPGDKVNITGTKIFQAPLEINNVEVLTLNQVPAKDLVFKTLLKDNNTKIQFNDTKSFTAIKVKNPAFIDKGIEASYLNNLRLEDLLNNDYYTDRLYVKNMLELSNLVFHKINGIPFDEFFTKLDIKDDRLVLHKDLIVEGNVQFVEALEVQNINDIYWNEYVENLVRINENVFIEGDVSFDQDLTITKEFETPEINDFDLEIILKNILMTSKPQMITGLYHFQDIKCSNINVPNINNVNVSEFVDLAANLTEIEGDLIVEKLNIGKNLRGHFKEYENLLDFKEKVSKLPLRHWKNLYVLNNASWPADVKDNSQQELLKYVYKTAVKSNQDQIITGNVKMSKPIITKMQTRLQFPPQLDIGFLKQDAVVRNTSQRTQYIKGKKVFLKPLNMESLTALHHLNTNSLNTIDILRFNRSLYRLTSHEPLHGPLKFIQPLIVDHLQVNGLINGLNTSLIYQLMPNLTLPPVKLQKLYVEHELNIKNINGMNLEYFLNNRLTLNGPALEHFGVLTFENLIIAKEALMQSINGIAIDNMVFKHSPYLQTITGHKTIGNFLELAGPAHVMLINNKDLMDLYRSSLMKNRNYQFDKLIIEQATFEGGLQLVENLDNNIQQRSSEDSEDITEINKKTFLRSLKEFKENLTNSIKDIMYLDYDLNTAIKWLDFGEATVVNRTILYELSRISCCEKAYLQISYQYPNNIYLKNITSNRLTVISDKISVKAKNYCKFRNPKVKSKISISGQTLMKVFGMKRYIETIYTLEIPSYPEYFVILHALDLPSFMRNEVRIFKITPENNTISDWQDLTQNIGEQLKLYKFTKLNILITNGLSGYHPAVTIYHLNNTNQLFILQQVIDGDYDIMKMLEMPNNAATKQLILSCSKCHRIFIYELNSSQDIAKYEIFQIIFLKSSIDKLVTFSLNNEYYMLVISKSDSNFYNIYKYSYIQGWLHLTFGYFPNLKMSIPLTRLWNKDNSLIVSQNLDGLPLILLCNVDDCYLVKAVV